jgi:flavin-dependent dehydrogenase
VKPVDVLILGGGPAGLATAIAAGCKGLSATLVDCAGPSIDKTCGEGLLPPAVAALAVLGVRTESLPGFPFKGIRFSDEKSSVEARFGGYGLGVRRDALHQALMERAAAAGVCLKWGARVSEIRQDGLCVDGEFQRCRWLIGADGQRSAVRKAAGLDPAKSANRLRYGFRRHFAMSPWSDVVEVYWGERVQLFVTPTGAEEICVVALTSDPRMRLDRALERFPHVAERLRKACAVSRETGAVTFFSRARRVARGNIALVGDASRSTDAISGQGIGLALREAIALADALAKGNLAAYSAEHARITQHPILMTRLLMLIDANATFRRAALRTLAQVPWLFSRLTALHSDGARGSQSKKMGPQIDGDAAIVAAKFCEHG